MRSVVIILLVLAALIFISECMEKKSIALDCKRPPGEAAWFSGCNFGEF